MEKRKKNIEGNSLPLSLPPQIPENRCDGELSRPQDKNEHD